MFHNPLVVGYKGEIGSFLLQGLLREMPKASDIWCFDINATMGEMQERFQKSDVIFLCVPIEATRNWLFQWQHALAGKVILEQCSLKGPVLHGFEQLTILSMHLLFRPSITPLADRTVAFIRHPLWEEYAETISHMTHAEPIFYDSIEQHDHDMALKQGLTHRILLILDAMQRQQGQGETYISKQIRVLVDRIRGGDPTLYRWIQSNRHIEPLAQQFVKQLENFHASRLA